MAFTESYHAARSLAFYEQPLVQALFWARPPGDTMRIAGTVLFAYDVLVKRLPLREVVDSDEAPVSVPERLGTDDD